MSIHTYFLKAQNYFYWWLDKLNKSAYIQKYPIYLRKLGIKISENPGDCWISPTVFFDSAGYDLIEIGNNCTISFDVVFLVHDYSINNAFRAIGERPAEKHRLIKRSIRVGDNCFIGARSVILPGAIIGDNCVIGSGAVVRGKIPSNSVVSGNPGVVIGQIDHFAYKHLNKCDFEFDTR